MSADYWNIRLKNQISTAAEQAVFADPVKYAAKFVRCGQASANLVARTCSLGGSFDPLGIAYIDLPNENLGEVRTDGFDLSLNYRFSVKSFGQVKLGYDGTYVRGYKFQREKDGEFIDNVGRIVDALPIFRWQHVLSAKWKWWDWSTLLANRYKSGYEDQNNPNARWPELIVGSIQFGISLGPESKSEHYRRHEKYFDKDPHFQIKILPFKQLRSA
jgi:iron complex outermembrane receptor protein